MNKPEQTLSHVCRVGAAVMLLTVVHTLSAHQAIAADDEYCVAGPPGEIITFREGPGEKTEEIGIGRDGSCGLWKTGECRDGWCKVQTHEFDGWLMETNLRRK